jgi:hypothetical protein
MSCAIQSSAYVATPTNHSFTDPEAAAVLEEEPDADVDEVGAPELETLDDVSTESALPTRPTP